MAIVPERGGSFLLNDVGLFFEGNPGQTHRFLRCVSRGRGGEGTTFPLSSSELEYETSADTRFIASRWMD